MCKYLIIKLSTQAVIVITNHNKSYHRHTWVDTNHRSTNHRPHRPSQNTTAQSGAWKAKQANSRRHKPRQAIQECTRRYALDKRGCRSPKFLDKLSCIKQRTTGQSELTRRVTSNNTTWRLHKMHKA